MARIIYFLEPLTTHPSLEVQERAVEYLELMRLASEAASGQAASSDDDFVEPPLLLTQAIPALFTGMELNPVAPGAQKKVRTVEGLELDEPINHDLHQLLRKADEAFALGVDEDDVHKFYFNRSDSHIRMETAAERLEVPEVEPASYHQSSNELLDPALLEKKRVERRERYRDDPFYIGSSEPISRASTPLHNIITNNNGEELDIDSIPIMDLSLEHHTPRNSAGDSSYANSRQRQRRFDIIVDENIGQDELPSRGKLRPDLVRAPQSKAKKSLLQVDSSGLGSLSLERGGEGPLEVEQRDAEENALREVERLRLEMQRASERIHAKDLPEEGTVVKRKKKKKLRGPNDATELFNEPAEEGQVSAVKKKKKKPKDSTDEAVEPGQPVYDPAIKPRKKKRRQVAMEEPVVERSD